MRTCFNRILLFAALVLGPSVSRAAESPVASDKDSFNFNPVLVGLVCLMLVLLYAIGILANVLRQLTYVIRDKKRAERSNAGNVARTTLLLIAFTLPALHGFAAADSVQAAVPVSNFINGIPKEHFYVLMSFITLELFAVMALLFYVRVFVRLVSNKPEAVPTVKVVMRSFFWEKFNKAVPIDKEKDILLDHDYDGIQELDNSLPPWWKYGFILTIIVAAIYLYRYQISGTGPNPQQEYAAEMKQADEDKAAYLAKSANNVDENTVTLLTDHADIDAGMQVFQTSCFPCHAKDGGGGVGPNLTDDYWLHGGSIKDVFKSIKYGWQDKGMKSWKDDFSPKQIAQIASYVKSLHGTRPAAPKEKQGELYIESTGTAKTDSTNKVAQK